MKRLRRDFGFGPLRRSCDRLRLRPDPLRLRLELRLELRLGFHPLRRGFAHRSFLLFVVFLLGRLVAFFFSQKIVASTAHNLFADSESLHRHRVVSVVLTNYFLDYWDAQMVKRSAKTNKKTCS